MEAALRCALINRLVHYVFRDAREFDDAADIERVFLDHDDRGHFLGEAIGGGETGRPGTDHEHFDVDTHRENNLLIYE